MLQECESAGEKNCLVLLSLVKVLCLSRRKWKWETIMMRGWDPKRSAVPPQASTIENTSPVLKICILSFNTSNVLLRQEIKSSVQFRHRYFFRDIFSSAQSRGAFRDFQLNPIQPSPTYSFWAFKPVYTEASKRSKAFYGDLWQSVALLDH